MSIAIIEELTDAEIADMPYDRLGELVLHHLVHTNLYSMSELLRDLGLENTHGSALSGPLKNSRPRLEAAINLLFDRGLVSSNTARGNEDGIVLTPEGKDILDIDDFSYRSMALDRVSNRVLHRELHHPRLCFLEGKYEDAMSKALETIEARVRVLSNPRKTNLDGAKLMKHAFGKNGTLIGGSGSRRMSHAVMDLFVGAVEADLNSLTYGRRPSLQYVLSVTEVILFANLLHHHLDQYDK